MQNQLSLDEDTYDQILKLYKETRHLLSANALAIGSGTVLVYFCSKILVNFNQKKKKTQLGCIQCVLSSQLSSKVHYKAF